MSQLVTNLPELHIALNDFNPKTKFVHEPFFINKQKIKKIFSYGVIRIMTIQYIILIVHLNSVQNNLLIYC